MRVHHTEVANDMKFLRVGLEPSEQAEGTLNISPLVLQRFQNTVTSLRRGRNLFVVDEKKEDSWKKPVAPAPHCFKCHSNTIHIKSLYDSKNGPSYHLFRCASCGNEMWMPVSK